MVVILVAGSMERIRWMIMVVLGRVGLLVVMRSIGSGMGRRGRRIRSYQGETRSRVYRCRTTISHRAAMPCTVRNDSAAEEEE